jgi:hypothetical protein
MSFLSQKKAFSKTQTSTTNGRKNAETACPKTNTTNGNHYKNNNANPHIKYHIFETGLTHAYAIMKTESLGLWIVLFLDFSVTGCFFVFYQVFAVFYMVFCHIPVLSHSGYVI